ncbi:MAG: hypothetical protein CMP98_03180 [Gammaproteobacteria bacterium]|nr:hypothetical protein [Gammaproteobacteria bacterium]OUU11030.1 MAG: hypothetical protein CBB94_03295 [Gammaproteobacteria bacterium TMED34]
MLKGTFIEERETTGNQVGDMEGTQQSAIHSFGALFLVITCNWHYQWHQGPLNTVRSIPTTRKKSPSSTSSSATTRSPMHQWLGKQWSSRQPDVIARWNGYCGLDDIEIVDE